MTDYAQQYAEVLHKMTGLPAVICDTEQAVASSGVTKKEIGERNFSSGMERLLQEKQPFTFQTGSQELKPFEGVDRTAYAVYPVLSSGDTMGAVLLLHGEKRADLGNAEHKLVQTCALLLGAQLAQ